MKYPHAWFILKQTNLLRDRISVTMIQNHQFAEKCRLSPGTVDIFPHCLLLSCIPEDFW